jgi:hypothetical protein
LTRRAPLLVAKFWLLVIEANIAFSPKKVLFIDLRVNKICVFVASKVDNAHPFRAASPRIPRNSQINNLNILRKLGAKLFLRNVVTEIPDDDPAVLASNHPDRKRLARPKATDPRWGLKNRKQDSIWV